MSLIYNFFTYTLIGIRELLFIFCLAFLRPGILFEFISGGIASKTVDKIYLIYFTLSSSSFFTLINLFLTLWNYSAVTSTSSSFTLTNKHFNASMNNYSSFNVWSSTSIMYKSLISRSSLFFRCYYTIICKSFQSSIF